MKESTFILQLIQQFEEKLNRKLTESEIKLVRWMAKEHKRRRRD